jgi:acetoin utilization protein AcuB
MGIVPLTVADFMSRVPHTIGAAQPLAAADRLMREHDLRHLPVLDVGRLVGILSQRELDLLLTAPEIDADKTPVSRAMMRDVLVVSPHDLVSQVAAKMAERRVGSAVVAKGGNVVGVFTTVDALRALTVTA